MDLYKTWNRVLILLKFAFNLESNMYFTHNQVWYSGKDQQIKGFKLVFEDVYRPNGYITFKIGSRFTSMKGGAFAL